jgi:hypothetical protein
LAKEETQSGEYFWSDHEAADELARLRLMEEFNDPSTFRQLEAIGVAEGWRCLEVGGPVPGLSRGGLLSEWVLPGKSSQPTSMCGFFATSAHKTSRSVGVTSRKIQLSHRRTTSYTFDRS